MKECCPTCVPSADRVYRRVLLLALILNAGMFLLEIGASVVAGSSSLLADAADFGGDAANYAISIAALAFAPMWRSRAALMKGLAMGAYGAAVLLVAAMHWRAGTLPQPATMGVVGILAISVNLGVAAMLYRYRNGDADMRSVWLCTRNDVIGNVGVLLAATGVMIVASGWPDYLVATLMGGLALAASVNVVRSARREILAA
jgi:Co/Zn/Cd efflux system component